MPNGRLPLRTQRGNSHYQAAQRRPEEAPRPLRVPRDSGEAPSSDQDRD